MWWFAMALAAEPAPDVLLDALGAELDRTMAAWKGEPDAPYFLSYRVTDLTSWTVSARYGALASSAVDRSRNLDVAARVGWTRPGNSRGIALVVPAEAGLRVAEYAPNQIKKTVTGVGHGEKAQIAMMVGLLLPKAKPQSADEADALAIAICHAQHRGSRERERAIAAKEAASHGGRGHTAARPKELKRATTAAARSNLKAEDV